MATDEELLKTLQRVERERGEDWWLLPDTDPDIRELQGVAKRLDDMPQKSPERNSPVIWYHEDDAFLRKNYKRYSIPEMADMLDVTDSVVKYRLEKLGLKKQYYTKAVVIVDEEGNPIRGFPSVTVAAKVMGVSISGITNACRGQQEHCGGYRWRYADMEEGAREEAGGFGV